VIDFPVDLGALLTHPRSRIRALSLSVYDDRGRDLVHLTELGQFQTGPCKDHVRPIP
jgi:hypothetical protein